MNGARSYAQPWPTYRVERSWIHADRQRRETVRAGLTHAQALELAEYYRASYVHPWAAYRVMREEE
jgi:hypothetical protein